MTGSPSCYMQKSCVIHAEVDTVAAHRLRFDWNIWGNGSIECLLGTDFGLLHILFTVVVVGRQVSVRKQHAMESDTARVVTRHACSTLLGLLLISCVLCTSVIALTPKSPEVRAMIERGMAQLESAPTHPLLGGKCLVAMVFVKDGQVDHPSVVEAIEACEEFAKKSVEEIANYREVYSLGISVVFLCDLDPLVHRRTIDKLLAGLYERHRINKSTKQNGGFGYLGRATGDTSMTQYGVLALWTAHRSGIEVPGDNVKEVCEWLLRTQDPSGAWGYQGTDPGPNSNRVKQTQIRNSMVAAGLGSVYVLSDLMGLNKMLKRVGTDVPDIPAALKPVPAASALPLKGMASRGLATRVKRAAVDGDAWLEKNFKAWPDQYPHYYLYALERCKSFRELAWGEEEKDAEWYDAGVRALATNEKQGGGWMGKSNGNLAVDTSFAILFLMRGTQKSIQRSLGSGSGLLVGGRGLPTDMSNVRLQGGRVVNSSFNVPANELLDILEAPIILIWKS